MSQIPWEHPQNPYDSFMVQASAGSGKTFQLSRRFLNLVASGANASQILTITFTVKAANEMRSRIIGEASRLLVDPNEQKAFDQQASHFYRLAKEHPSAESFDLKPPRSAIEVGHEILSATQLLKISTIDALFKDWVAKFPWEASLDHDSPRSSVFQMLDPMDLTDLNKSSWLALFSHDESEQILKQVWETLAKSDQDKGPLTVEQRIYELFRLRTFLWQSEKNDEDEAFRAIAPVLHKAAGEASLSAVIKEIQVPLETIASSTKRSEDMLAAISRGDFDSLVSLRLLTKDAKIHKGTIRAKKQELFRDEMVEVEDALQNYFNRIKVKQLNDMGRSLYKLYKNWIIHREHEKNRLGVLEFNDLTMACFSLFYSEHGNGAIWLLQRSMSHLLLDEFQDTSLLQWSVFQKLSEELIAGLGASSDDGVIPSVFVVGDKKQSIYGFREADPEVMDLAQQSLESFEKSSLPLNASYRTCQLLLDFINQVFKKISSDFPDHSAAKTHQGDFFVPNIGGFGVHELFEADEDHTAIENEAKFVAKYLNSALNGDEEKLIWDKHLKKFRPLRPRDCCILYRNSTHASTFEQALRREQVPYLIEEKRGFFARSEISDILALIHHLLYPYDLVALSQLLRSPICSYTDQSLYDLMEAAKEAAVGHEDFSRQAVEMIAVNDPSLYQRLLYWREEARKSLPHQVVIGLFNDFNILARYQAAFGGIEGPLAEANLLKFLELCTDLEDQGEISIAQVYLRLCEIRSKSELAAARPAAEAVTLMTIHKSKGLEFGLVILIEAGERWYQGDRFWTKQKSAAPGVSFVGTKSQQPCDYPPFQSLLGEQVRDMEAEAIRLLYVALTRASQYLLVTGHQGQAALSGHFLEVLLEIAQRNGHVNSQYPKFWVGETSRDDLARFSVEAEGAEINQGEGRADDPGEKPEFVPSMMPFELSILQPHAEHEKKTSGGAELEHARLAQVNPAGPSQHPPWLAAAIGTFIHEAFESASEKKNWNESEAWERIVLSHGLARRLRWSGQQWKQILAASLTEIRQTTSSEEWKDLHKNTLSLRAEMPVLQIKGQRLVRGVVDLFLEYDQTIVLLDYKSAEPGFRRHQFQEQEGGYLNAIDQFCRERSYDWQLYLYCSAIKAIYPHKRVIGLIWLSKLALGSERVRID